jgi:energy-coupling factor transporter ATP-binding protein EcfA2
MESNILSRYLYCGQTVLSNIAIPELALSNNSKTFFLFGLEESQQQSTEFSWSSCWKDPSGEVELAYGKKDSNHWLRYPELADFRISTSLEEITCYPVPEIPLETIRHLLLDSVLPRCMARQGKLMVHASAVRLETGILILVGDSGAGKSTLAAYFHQAGQSAISDDVVWVKENQDQQIRAVPSYSGLRLWVDSLNVLFANEQNIHSMAHYSEKKRVLFYGSDLMEYDNSNPILAVIVLSAPNQVSNREIRLRPLSRSDAFMEILNETFQLESFDLQERTTRMRALGRMVTRLPSYQLSMPRDYDLLPAVRQRILEAVL